MVSGYEYPTGFLGAGPDDNKICFWREDNCAWKHLPDSEKLLGYSRMNALCTDLFQRRISHLEPLGAVALQVLSRSRREWLQDVEQRDASQQRMPLALGLWTVLTAVG